MTAVVSRGGRPDLAGPLLPAVTAPTLLIVGGYDEAVLELNRKAQAALRCMNHLTVVPEATHLFEEPGALESVAQLACDWFVTTFERRRPHRRPRPRVSGAATTKAPVPRTRTGIRRLVQLCSGRRHRAGMDLNEP